VLVATFISSILSLNWQFVEVLSMSCFDDYEYVRDDYPMIALTHWGYISHVQEMEHIYSTQCVPQYI